MCDWAYHHEALRKQRVIQRKLEAQARLDTQKHGQNQYAELERTDRDKEFGNNQPGLSDNQGDQRRQIYAYPYNQNQENHVISQAQIRKDLLHRQKVLRNHNLVMGPMDAFSELDDQGQTSWK